MTLSIDDTRHNNIGIMLGGIMLSVVILSVTMLRVMAPV